MKTLDERAKTRPFTLSEDMALYADTQPPLPTAAIAQWLSFSLLHPMESRYPDCPCRQIHGHCGGASVAAILRSGFHLPISAAKGGGMTDLVEENDGGDQRVL
ncbi:hypothetical protein ACLOJK_033224 [Asimina triloba]